MEIFVIIIIIWIIIASISDNTSDNSSSSFEEPPAFKYRKKMEKFGENDLDVVTIQNKGMFPISKDRNLGFCTSIFDVTDGSDKRMPVICYINEMQEKDTTVFKHILDVGRIEVYTGYTKWISVGGVLLDSLQPPYSGERKLEFVMRLIDMDYPPVLDAGFATDLGGEALHFRSLYHTHFFEEKGYKEISEGREKSRVNAIELSMAIAFSDGHFDENEGKVVRDWIKDKLEYIDGERRNELKNLYNNAMKDSYEKAKQGKLSIKTIINSLNKIDIMPQKIEAMELCFHVIAADGKADKKEMKMINKLANDLGIDWSDMEKLRDQSIVKLKSKETSNVSMEDLLGINSSWTKKEIKKHLTKEFQKWNDRLTTLPEGKQRDNAQLMLSRIADARKKYDS